MFFLRFANYINFSSGKAVRLLGTIRNFEVYRRPWTARRIQTTRDLTKLFLENLKVNTFKFT